MAEVFGKSGSDLRERIGSLGQVVRVDSLVEAEGPARGARRLRLVNGGGLELEVHPDRAMDLGQLTVDGIPVAWMSPTGIVAPEFREPEGLGWLRTFGGGLHATCGLDTFGPPSEDGGAELGMHGRIGAQPAVVTRMEATSAGVVVEGTIRQAGVFGENLVLRRKISSAAGSDTVVVDDTVTNESFEDSPHMVLYHVNLGWPLLDDDTVIDIPSTALTPRDVDAELGIADWREAGSPIPGYREQVFRHDVEGTEDVRLRVTNARLGVEFSLGISGAQLPCVYQWKMMGQGNYVLGVEPANCRNVFGRAAAREAGELPILSAGDSVSYRLEFRLRRVESADANLGEGEAA
jgi:hypothetical protein